MAKTEKEKRIAKEIRAMKAKYKEISGAHGLVAERMIEKAAYQKVTLDDLEADLDENGWTEGFRQSASLEPYERKRPSADIYISLSAQYQRTMKQLDAMLPAVESRATDDELMAFLSD
ncbi:hypothetical protein [Shuttleworthella satelles]|uniref:Uncharacterized protein n=1 Tax=Shuttleworthella satelles DSM 14600 TaxID=626523 RepID=C4GAS8_9FIRM|nr:hypothetical protein [Shuttleworthia satelles]EEP28221.1 hypothetical protein GCWU000342_01029 [Shuttleworthia satelles DSM 14600]